MAKKFKAVNRISGETWKPQKIYAGKQYLMLYDSGYVCGVGVLSAGKVSRT